MCDIHIPRTWYTASIEMCQRIQPGAALVSCKCINVWWSWRDSWAPRSEVTQRVKRSRVSYPRHPCLFHSRDKPNSPFIQLPKIGVSVVASGTDFYFLRIASRVWCTTKMHFGEPGLFYILIFPRVHCPNFTSTKASDTRSSDALEVLR